MQVAGLVLCAGSTKAPSLRRQLSGQQFRTLEAAITSAASGIGTRRSGLWVVTGVNNGIDACGLSAVHLLLQVARRSNWCAAPPASPRALLSSVIHPSQHPLPDAAAEKCSAGSCRAVSPAVAMLTCACGTTPVSVRFHHAGARSCTHCHDSLATACRPPRSGWRLSQPSSSRTPTRSQGGLHGDYKVGRLPKHEPHATPAHTWPQMVSGCSGSCQLLCRLCLMAWRLLLPQQAASAGTASFQRCSLRHCRLSCQGCIGC